MSASGAGSDDALPGEGAADAGLPVGAGLAMSLQTADIAPAVVLDEQDIAAWLLENPDFFLRHGQTLLAVRITDPNSGRAISLHERQLEVLRENERALQRRLAELVRTGQENDAIADRLARFTRDLLLVGRAREMPGRIEVALADSFRVPLVAVRLWDVAPTYADEAFAIEPAGEFRRRLDDMMQPYCGLRTDLAPVHWFDEAQSAVRSVALIPLRHGALPHSFGLIMLASPDPDRFQSGMGTAFLERIAEVAGAALLRLRADVRKSPAAD